MRYCGQDILKGRDISHFRNFLIKELKESQEKEELTPPVPTETEAGIVVTSARQWQQDTLEEEECLRQDRMVQSTPHLI